MASRNYTTEFQVMMLIRRLRILSGAINLEGLSYDQLLSTLQTIHENHISLSNLLIEPQPKEKNQQIMNLRRMT